VFWLVMFAVILVAANALGLESLANVFSELVSYIPSVIAAIVIILGRYRARRIRRRADLGVGRCAARWSRSRPRWARRVILLAIFMALQELGIATDIVTTAFAILFGAIALAMALSFGLGNRELAGEITREWYNSYRAERDDALRREREFEEREDREMETEYPESAPTEAEGRE
jgi:hypothetical protein